MLKGKKVCVTGAGGFLGKHLLPLLIENGAEVTALVRRPDSQLSSGARRVIGDCRNREQMRSILKDQEIIIHLAATLFAAHWQDYLAANTEAARNIASESCHAERIVLVSSLAAAGPCATSPGRKETEAAAPVSAYGWSKLLAEQTAKAIAGEKVVILRPPILYGPHDKGLLPLFKSAKLGIGIAPNSFPVSLLYASDAAKACLLACKPNANGIYHLGDGNIYQMADICETMAKVQGRKTVHILHPPQFLMRLTAQIAPIGNWLVSRILASMGRSGLSVPSWNPDKYLESIQEGWLADTSRICNELAFKPAFGLEEGIKAAVAFYRSEAWL